LFAHKKAGGFIFFKDEARNGETEGNFDTEIRMILKKMKA